MGLPREFHEQCRRSLELDYLKVFYCWARGAALSVTSKILDSDLAAPEVKVCTAAMRLMLQILTWEFQYNRKGTKSINHFSAGVRHDNALTNRTDCILVQPGLAWHDVLISSGDTVWLSNLYAALRQKFSPQSSWIDSPIAVSARKLLVQFCSVTGTIFPSDSGQSQEQYLVRLLSGIILWVEPSDAISKEIESGKSGSEMLDGCRALLAMATVTTPAAFDRLLKSIRPYGTLTLLSTLMGEVIKVLISQNSEEETWSWEARDILLDTWTALLMHSLQPLHITGGGISLPPEGAVAAANLFALIVDSELKAASASAYNDDSDSDYIHASISAMDERLSSYALIARAAIDVTVPLLTRLFTERVSRLHQGRGIVDPTETLEELYSLLLITGHVLADEGEGETPLVPDAIQRNFGDFLEADKHPVVLLSGSIIKFAEHSLDPDLRASFFSPRLMEAVIWFLSRWSPTYLMSLEETHDRNDDSLLSRGHQLPQNSRKTVANYFSEYSYGKFVLGTIVRVSIITFTSYPGENYLQGMTCYQLLHALVRQKNICVHLVALESWRELANAFAHEKMLFMLNASHQRSLAQTLVLSASGLGNSEAANQYVKDLMGHMTKYLVELSSRNDIRSISQQPDIILSITCSLERLRGAARASEPRMQKSIYEMGLSVLNAILVLLEVYKHESSVVYVLLKFVVAWVDAQITYLEAKETAAVVDFCMRLLQLYSSHNIGKISLSLSNSLLSDAKTEKYKDLRALLQLLSALCLKDLVDLSSDPVESEGTNISQVVFFGLHIVTPLISLELLKYPKLCHDYFSLLSHMLEVYPEMVGQLNNDAFSHVVETLSFGLHHQDSEVVNMCLKALRALASYHCKETAAGKVGLGSRASDPRNPSGGTENRIFSRFLQSLLQLLLFGDYSPDLVGAAADALFPMILCEQSLYQKLGNELIERQANPEFRLRLTNAFQALTSLNQLTCTLDRMNYQRFRKNLSNFLIEVRGFLRTK
ncbi:exportin-4 isoform X3 [Punica granatum]|nr:exportin-4 isoform X3 [Punica granatum]